MKNIFWEDVAQRRKTQKWEPLGLKNFHFESWNTEGKPEGGPFGRY